MESKLMVISISDPVESEIGHKYQKIVLEEKYTFNGYLVDEAINEVVDILPGDVVNIKFYPKNIYDKTIILINSIERI